MKKSICLFLVIFVLLSQATAFAALEDSQSADRSLSDVLTEAYISFTASVNEYGFGPKMSLEVFCNEYDMSDIEMYIEKQVNRELIQKAEFDISQNERLIRNDWSSGESVLFEDSASTTRSGDGMWYDCIGVYSPTLPQAASYSTHNLLDVVSFGDIVHESSGGPATITGHSSFISGKYYSTSYNQFYIATIEANASGVVYGALEDTRYDYRSSTIYSVSVVAYYKNNAHNFCISQLGKSYAYTWLETGLLYSNTYSVHSASNTAEWYCSELVWAAYYNEGYGVNLAGASVPLHIYYPLQLTSSSYLTAVTVS